MNTSSVKVVVITGCSSGIGLNTAVVLARESNVKVLATMRNLQKKGDLEKAAASSLNKTLFIHELDVSKAESIENFLKHTYENEGRIDVLINNAGIGQHGHFETVTLEQMQSVFQTNVFGPSMITQGVIRKMKEQKSGHIIFLSSIGGIIPFPFSDFYTGTKFALEGIATSLCPVLLQYNIRVTIVEPGPVLTSMTEYVIKTSERGSSTSDAPSPDIDAGVDDLAISLRKTALASVEQWIKQYLQTPDVVAELIKDCIFNENPPVRIQTSAAMLEQAKEILKDPTGNETLKKSAGMLQPQKQ